MRERASERGLETDSPEALKQALFSDGLTTTDRVSDVSGRGVGLSSVREAVERLGGSISIDSEPQRGTSVEIRLSESVLRAA